MRGLLVLLPLVLLAGCATTASPAPPIPTVALASVPSGPPSHANGTVWIPMTQNQARANIEIPFDVHQGNATLEAKLHLGSRTLVDTPRALTPSVRAELRAPDGATIGKASLDAPIVVDATIHATGHATGRYALILLTYGGSDGKSMGDFVNYVLDGSAS